MAGAWVPYRVRTAGPEAVAAWNVLQEEFSAQLDTMVRRWCNAAVDYLGAKSVARINNLLAADAVALNPRTSSNHPHTVKVDAGHLLDVADALVHLLDRVGNDANVVDLIFRLNDHLDEGRSVYEVRPDATGEHWSFGRRVDPTVTAQAQRVMDAGGTHADYLRAAWHACYDLHPDDEAAFDKAIEAIEAAARPVISPNNTRATLGTMIRDLKQKPSKWTTTLGTVEQLTERLQALWSIQPRHGTPDPNEVREVTREEAVACVHEAVTLVHAFTTGLIRLEGA